MTLMLVLPSICEVMICRNTSPCLPCCSRVLICADGGLSHHLLAQPASYAHWAIRKKRWIFGKRSVVWREATSLRVTLWCIDGFSILSRAYSWHCMNCQCHTDNRTWMCVEGKGPLEWRMFTLLSTLNRSSYKVHNVLLENLLDISNGYNHLPCQGIFTQSSVCSHLCVCVCVCVWNQHFA